MNDADYKNAVVYAAMMAAELYFAGKLSAEAYIAVAGDFLECSSPFENNGDMMCCECIDQFLAG